MRGLAILAVALAFAVSGCDNHHHEDTGGGGDDGSGNGSGGGSSNNPPAKTFAAFVIDLVKNRTANNTEPAAAAEFESLPDPDANNEHAFSSLFE